MRSKSSANEGMKPGSMKTPGNMKGKTLGPSSTSKGPSRASTVPLASVASVVPNASTAPFIARKTTVATSVYIHGVQMKSNEPLFKGLAKIYGIGPKRVQRACRAFSMTNFVKVGDMSRDQIVRRESWISQNTVIESSRRRKVSDNIKRLMMIASNRGIRMRNGRPVRGQRTSTNGKTARRLNRYRVAM